jgi:hypothetical protein
MKQQSHPTPFGFAAFPKISAGERRSIWGKIIQQGDSQMKTKFDWMTALKLIAVLVISGFVWTYDNQLVMLSLLSMVLVWGVKVYRERTGRKVSKFHLTGVLLAISIGFAFLFQGFTLPAFPIFDGDVILFANALFAWAGLLLAAGREVFAFATGLYNLLAADVFKKLEETPALSRFLQKG